MFARRRHLSQIHRSPVCPEEPRCQAWELASSICCRCSGQVLAHHVDCCGAATHSLRVSVAADMVRLPPVTRTCHPFRRPVASLRTTTVSHDRFGSLRHHAAARYLHFRVMAHQKCHYSCHNRTGRQHHKAERCFASRILDPANSIGADKVALALENSNHSSSHSGAGKCSRGRVRSPRPGESLRSRGAGDHLPGRLPSIKAEARRTIRRMTPSVTRCVQTVRSPHLERRVAEPHHVCRQRPRWLTRTVIKC